MSMSHIAVVTTKGQLVIPSPLRSKHNIRKGTRVCLIEHGQEIILRPITDAYVEGIKGMLKTSGKLTRALLAEKKREKAL